MEELCKWCNQLIVVDDPRKFGAHLTNCKSNPNKIKRDINSKKKKKFKLTCKCGKKYIIEVTEHNFNIGKYNKFCSRSCANRREHTQEQRDKVSKSLKLIPREKHIYSKKCPNCNQEYTTRLLKQICCSRRCNLILRNKTENLCSKGGKKSVHSQKRRSKNEMCFFEYCEENFKKVLSNESIFNGWDADIIIEDIKVAILWNGIWHYKKITEKHDLDKITERENRKIIEIKKCGYIPYIIKDMGGFDEEKVEMEWEIFKIWTKNQNIKIS